jgi:hypothetical protein
VANTHSTNQRRETLCIENISHQSVSFALIKPSFGAASDNATGILPSMLQKAESFTNFWAGFGLVIMQ